MRKASVQANACTISHSEVNYCNALLLNFLFHPNCYSRSQKKTLNFTKLKTHLFHTFPRTMASSVLKSAVLASFVLWFLTHIISNNVNEQMYYTSVILHTSKITRIWTFKGIVNRSSRVSSKDTVNNLRSMYLKLCFSLTISVFIQSSKIIKLKTRVPDEILLYMNLGQYA